MRLIQITSANLQVKSFALCTTNSVPYSANSFSFNSPDFANNLLQLHNECVDSCSSFIYSLDFLYFSISPLNFNLCLNKIFELQFTDTEQHGSTVGVTAYSAFSKSCICMHVSSFTSIKLNPVFCVIHMGLDKREYSGDLKKVFKDSGEFNRWKIFKVIKKELLNKEERDCGSFEVWITY